MKLEISKRRRALGAAAALGACGLLGVSALNHRAHATDAVGGDPGISVEADVSERMLYLKEGGDVVDSFQVAVGKGSKPTPRGNYKIRKIIWNPAWIPPDEPWAKHEKPQAPGARGNPMKLVKIFFREPDYYIHGTGNVESLGEAASHGCLRMDPDDAYRVARWLMDNGGSPRDENWFWRVLHFRSETKTVYLDNPVPMVVKD
jgi:lipoprotein-anchoring transpeptidase ErfK/SrfK